MFREKEFSDGSIVYTNSNKQLKTKDLELEHIVKTIENVEINIMMKLYMCIYIYIYILSFFSFLKKAGKLQIIKKYFFDILGFFNEIFLIKVLAFQNFDQKVPKIEQKK